MSEHKHNPNVPSVPSDFIQLSHIRTHEVVTAKRPGGGGGDTIYTECHFSLKANPGTAMGDRGNWDLRFFPQRGLVSVQHHERPDMLPVLVPLANISYMTPHDPRPRDDKGFLVKGTGPLHDF